MINEINSVYLIVLTSKYLYIEGGIMNNFLEDTTRFVNQAIKFIPISKGLANKITTCNSTYTVRFGVRLRGDI